MEEIMNLSRYNNKEILDFPTIEKRSFYCHQYYHGYDNDIIYGLSDDDNHTDYYLENMGMLWFAESFTNERDVMHVFNEYLQ